MGRKPSAVAGFFVPDVRTTFEIAMGITVLPALDKIKPESFLPSSRSVAFTKEAWAAAGGYPEWIDYCEELILDFRLRDVAGPFGWAPEALAHFRPRLAEDVLQAVLPIRPRGRQGGSLAQAALDSFCHLSDRPARPDRPGIVPLAGLVAGAARRRNALLRHAVSPAAAAPAKAHAHRAASKLCC